MPNSFSSSGFWPIHPKWTFAWEVPRSSIATTGDDILANMGRGGAKHCLERQMMGITYRERPLAA